MSKKHDITSTSASSAVFQGSSLSESIFDLNICVLQLPEYYLEPLVVTKKLLHRKKMPESHQSNFFNVRYGSKFQDRGTTSEKKLRQAIPRIGIRQPQEKMEVPKAFELVV